MTRAPIARKEARGDAHGQHNGRQHGDAQQFYERGEISRFRREAVARADHLRHIVDGATQKNTRLMGGKAQTLA